MPELPTIMILIVKSANILLYFLVDIFIGKYTVCAYFIVSDPDAQHKKYFCVRRQQAKCYIVPSAIVFIFFSVKSNQLKPPNADVYHLL